MHVIARPADGDVVAGTAIERIVAAESPKLVVAALTLETIGAPVSEDGLTELVAGEIEADGERLVGGGEELDLDACAESIARRRQNAIAALADALGLRRATLSLRSGATGRDKIIAVTDAPPDLADRVARLRDAPP